MTHALITQLPQLVKERQDTMTTIGIIPCVLSVTILWMCGIFADLLSTENGNPEPCFFTHETVFTVPANRQRLRLGVCEQVDLTAPALAKWTVTGGGFVSQETAVKTRYSAPSKASGTVTITAVIGNRSCSVVFTVVIPDGVTMKAVAPFYHAYGLPSAGFVGTNIVLTPADVSFKKIMVVEGIATGKGTGVFTSINGLVHPFGTPYHVIDGNIVNGSDEVSSTGRTPPNGTNYTGTFEWNIPWSYNCPGPYIPMFNVLHHVVSDAAGKTTITKATASATTNRNDPSVSF